MVELSHKTNQPWRAVEPNGRMLRPNDVVERTGLSRSQIYQMISEERFPPFIKLSTRASAMPEAWLNAFIEMRVRRALDRPVYPIDGLRTWADARTTGEQK